MTPDLVHAFSALRGEPAWVRELRLRGWEAFISHPLPTRRDEGWRRTDLRGMDLDALLNPPTQAAPGSGPADCARDVLAPPGEVAGTLVVQDTAEVARELDTELDRRGVKLLSLERAIREHPELVEPRLMTLAAPDAGWFQGLQGAFFSGGAFVYVPRGVQVEKPLQIVHGGTEPGQSTFPRTLVVAESGADVTVLETYVSEERVGAVFSSAAVELIPGEGAGIHYVGIQEWNEQTWHFNTIRSAAERDSRVSIALVSFGARLGRTELDARLDGLASEAEIVGVVFGGGDQQIEHLTLQDHVAPRTRSELLFKAALRDNASSNFNGLIRVNRDASETWSNMETRNLLLSGTAKADADPRLEILNSDVVRCSHGATVGPMDEEVLFYVMSRGIAREEAQRLVVEAFFAPALQRIPLLAVRDRIWRSIQRELED